MTPKNFRDFIYNLSLFCLLVNLLVKVGIIYGFKCKEVLVLGCIFDLCGVWMVSRLGRWH